MRYEIKIVGTCSRCRGPVIEEYGINSKILRCRSCGATKHEDYGPVIQMDGQGDLRWGVMYEVK